MVRCGSSHLFDIFSLFVSTYFILDALIISSLVGRQRSGAIALFSSSSSNDLSLAAALFVAVFRAEVAARASIMSPSHPSFVSLLLMTDCRMCSFPAWLSLFVTGVLAVVRCFSIIAICIFGEGERTVAISSKCCTTKLVHARYRYGHSFALITCNAITTVTAFMKYSLLANIRSIARDTPFPVIVMLFVLFVPFLLPPPSPAPPTTFCLTFSM
mmetsp:Transcript_36379/g.58915  ORF Transcript_36379/g.58915 Transcript_36379/m.58915 type:complete len:214 (+) Transcript_36379:392-1033(+)